MRVSRNSIRLTPSNRGRWIQRQAQSRVIDPEGPDPFHEIELGVW